MTIVVKETKGKFRRVKRFRTYKQAVAWLGRTRDQKAVVAGRYTLDVLR